MEDTKIIELYWRRDESAIDETDRKYGRSCRSIAYDILSSREDSEECVNDHIWRRGTASHRAVRQSSRLISTG